MLLHEKYVDDLVEKVVARLTEGGAGPVTGAAARATDGTAASVAYGAAVPRPAGADEPLLGVFDDVEEAISAALRAAEQLATFPQSRRGEIITRMRQVVLDNLEFLARIAREETGMGRVEDKINKNRLVAEKTPGVEDLHTGATTGDRGITLDEFAPFGVIGAVIPSTNPTETVINNGIGMFAAGNAVVFNPHPNATICSLTIMSMLNRVIVDAGGPENCFVAVRRPTIETAGAVMNHPRIPFLAVTGSEGVVHAAMKTGKKVAAAGPGNPPAVVDETAHIARAARDIVMGGSLDNGIICIAEKVTVVVASVAEQLVAEMERAGGYRASVNQIRALENELFAENPQPRQHTPVKREYVGKDAAVLLSAIGTRVDGDPRLILCEVDPDHPFAWTEMLMPVMPIVRMPDVDAAIEYAVAVERGNRHTASMHSRNIDKLTEMGRRINCSVYVKNGPTYAGLGMGGEGLTSFTIASPTGDGLTTARTFSRRRRCALVGNYSIV